MWWVFSQQIPSYVVVLHLFSTQVWSSVLSLSHGFEQLLNVLALNVCVYIQTKYLYVSEDTILAHIEAFSKSSQFKIPFLFSPLSVDDAFPKIMVVPIPVPVYVPVPMNMYSQCTPRPVGLPVPVRQTHYNQLWL